jgi:hypothetical protein
MVRASILVTSCAVLFGVSAACGARTGLPGEAIACTGEAVGQIKQVPNLYFILDRSSSMTDGTPAKWPTVRNDIADLMATLGSDARFGAAWFPPPPGDDCGAGAEVMPLRLGDGKPSSMAGSTANVFLLDTSLAPHGGTPTAETFLALTPKLAGLADETNPKSHTFAILATDGGPNCNLALSCGVATCCANIDMLKPTDAPTCEPDGPNCCELGTIPGDNAPQQNCLDGARTVAAVAALKAAGVPTFAIGVPGSDAPAYVNVLDQVAQAGGTARATEPYYYPVDTSKQNELVDALSNIAARIAASCVVELKSSPDPNLTNIVIANDYVPQSGSNGWTLSGNLVTLLGETCDAVKTEGTKVIVTEGCPIVR